MSEQGCFRESLKDYSPSGCQSPIEEMMGGALALVSAHAWWLQNGQLWIVEPQHEVGRFRVDFALLGEHCKIAVECDGHDFHEKTKHQAARDKSRDRELAAAGFTVLRFTGSEIWADPIACATQAVDLACLHWNDAMELYWNGRKEASNGR